MVPGIPHIPLSAQALFVTSHWNDGTLPSHIAMLKSVVTILLIIETWTDIFFSKGHFWEWKAVTLVIKPGQQLKNNLRLPQANKDTQTPHLRESMTGATIYKLTIRECFFNNCRVSRLLTIIRRVLREDCHQKVGLWERSSILGCLVIQLAVQPSNCSSSVLACALPGTVC